MKYIILIGIFSCICLHFGNSKPSIMIRSSSSSKSTQLVDGKPKTVYDVRTLQEASDLSGKMVYSRSYDFNSDYAPAVHTHE